MFAPFLNKQSRYQIFHLLSSRFIYKLRWYKIFYYYF